MNNPPQVGILTTEFKTNMTICALPLISKIRQAVSGIFSCRKVQTLSAELSTTAIVLTASGQLQIVLDEKLLANELERSRIELEARSNVGSNTKGEV